jgi:ligand-binding sensor domain-containing protein
MKLASLFMICTTFWGYTLGQDYTTRIQQLGSHEGLSDNAVHAVALDPRGYLWIATESGLNRYDGFNVKEFNSTNSALRSDFIGDVYFIDDGTLVVLTVDESRPNVVEGL